MIRLASVFLVSFTLVLANAAWLDALAATAKPKTDQSKVYAWETVISEVRKQTDESLKNLKLVRATLIKRAEKEDRRLIERLYLERSIRPGYGVVPEIGIEQPERTVTLAKRTFSLQRLAARMKRYRSALSRLDKRSSTESEKSLTSLVKEFERLRGGLRNVEKNLSYHSFWQRSAIRVPRYYAKRNSLATVIGEMMALRKKGNDPERLAILQQRVRGRLVPFRKIRPGLAPEIKETNDRALVMTVTIFTDIADEKFLTTFSESIRDLVSRSAEARNRQFSIDLRLRRISSNKLYPDGAPKPGAKIDRKAHLARFPKDTYVLTTGGKSTHVYAGRAIMLGPGNRSRRTLAHEFLHLLGFADTYVRSYTGAPEDPFGVLFFEWIGLTNDIMGDPGPGRVSDKIIETIISAYSLNGAATR